MKNQHGRLQHRIGIGSVPHFTLPSGKEKFNSEKFCCQVCRDTSSLINALKKKHQHS
jgi:hypothetical protein